MTRTLGIVEPDHDLSRAGFVVVDELESVRQRIVQRLTFWFRTWFLEQNAGVPYLQDVFGRQPDERLAARIITEQIRDVADVTGVRDVQFRIDSDRVARYSATIDTRFGEMSLDQEIG